jgi:integrase
VPSDASVGAHRVLTRRLANEKPLKDRRAEDLRRTGERRRTDGQRFMGHADIATAMKRYSGKTHGLTCPRPQGHG